MEKFGTLTHCWWECEMMKTSMAFSQKDEHGITVGFGGATSRNEPVRKKTQTGAGTGTCTLTGPLPADRQTTGSPSTGCYSALTMNEVLTHNHTIHGWTSKKLCWVKEARQKRVTCHTYNFIDMKYQEGRNPKADWGWGGLGSDCSVGMSFPLGMMKCFGTRERTLWMYWKPL